MAIFGCDIRKRPVHAGFRPNQQAVATGGHRLPLLCFILHPGIMVAPGGAVVLVAMSDRQIDLLQAAHLAVFPEIDSAGAYLPEGSVLLVGKREWRFHRAQI